MDNNTLIMDDTLEVEADLQKLKDLYLRKQNSGQVDDRPYLPLTKENLNKVKRNEFCVIEIPLLSKEASEQLLRELSNAPWQKYRNIKSQELPLLGVNLFDHYQDQKEYVLNSLKMEATLDFYVPIRTAAISILKSMLREANGADVDTIFIEEQQAYGFTGAGKQLIYSNTHTDYVPRQSPDGFSFPKIKNQIAMNLFVSDVPEGTGGECLIFNKMYAPEDDAYRLPESLGYGHKAELFSDVPFKVVKPTQGSAFLFSAEYYHCILPSDVDRYTISFFLGELEDGRLAMWA